MMELFPFKGTMELQVCQANNQTMVIPRGAPPSSSPCFCFSLREESKSKSMFGTGNTETEIAISKIVLREKEREIQNNSWRL
jgi:hypothetical protein